MPPHGKKQKRAEDKRSVEEIALEAAKNSHYNLFTPLFNAENIRFHDPVTLKDVTFRVTDENFYQLFYDYSQKGLKEKFFSELESFVAYDSKWQSVIDSLNGFFKIKETDTNER